jgi:hypothetical protein
MGSRPDGNRGLERLPCREADWPRVAASYERHGRLLGRVGHRLHGAYEVISWLVARRDWVIILSDNPKTSEARRSVERQTPMVPPFVRQVVRGRTCAEGIASGRRGAMGEAANLRSKQSQSGLQPE